MTKDSDNRPISGTWTAERVAILRKMDREGKYAKEIAEALGNGITRNAVLGKLFRLRGKRYEKDSPKRIKLKGVPSPKGLKELKNNECQWAIEDKFCGKENYENYPYCEKHCARAFSNWGKI